MDTDNDIYRLIHFAVMSIENGARKLGDLRQGDARMGTLCVNGC